MHFKHTSVEADLLLDSGCRVILLMFRPKVVLRNLFKSSNSVFKINHPCWADGSDSIKNHYLNMIWTANKFNCHKNPLIITNIRPHMGSWLLGEINQKEYVQLEINVLACAHLLSFPPKQTQIYFSAVWFESVSSDSICSSVLLLMSPYRCSRLLAQCCFFH